MQLLSVLTRFVFYVGDKTVGNFAKIPWKSVGSNGSFFVGNTGRTRRWVLFWQFPAGAGWNAAARQNHHPSAPQRDAGARASAGPRRQGCHAPATEAGVVGRRAR